MRNFADMSEQGKLAGLRGWLSRFVSVWTLVGLVIIGYLSFSNDTDVRDSVDLDRTIDSLRTELSAIKDTTELYRQLNSRLISDPDMMEQVVREEYGMRREHEDVYIFKE